MAVLLPLLGAGGWAYLDGQHIAFRQAGPALAALLIEAACFLSIGSAAARAWWRPWTMAASVAVPALIVGGNPAVLAIAAALAYWYVVLPKRPGSDAALAVVWAVLTLGKVSNSLYPEPVGRIPLAILGELAWIRIIIWGALELRRLPVQFGFLPTAREWWAGLKWYAIFLPMGIALVWLTGFSTLRGGPWVPWKLAVNAIGNFLGFYIFVALREEFVLRGLLLGWMMEAMRSPRTAQVVTAALCGLGHLPFRQFPNWKFAIIAGVAHYIYGLAFLEGRSLRTAMICHALVVVTWRVLLQS